MESRLKLCTHCGEIKPRSEFYQSRRGNLRTIASPCKPCYKALYSYEYRRSLKEAVNA